MTVPNTLIIMKNDVNKTYVREYIGSSSLEQKKVVVYLNLRLGK